MYLYKITYEDLTYFGSSSYKNRFNNHKRDWRYYNENKVFKKPITFTSSYIIFDKAYATDGNLKKVHFTIIENLDALVDRQTCVARELELIRNNPCVNLIGKGKGCVRNYYKTLLQKLSQKSLNQQGQTS